MTVRWAFFLVPLAVTLALLWALLHSCAPPLCWFLLSIALATLLVLVLACMTSLACCVCRGGRLAG